MPAPNLVLSGGNALGAYHAGVCSALEEAGVTPGWIASASIGAVSAAIYAGNSPGTRAAALRQFWDRASAFDPLTALLPPALQRPLHYAQALASRTLGRPPLFGLRPPDLSGEDRRPSVFAVDGLRRLVAELVDFDRLNDGAIRVSVLAVELATGQEAVFDTRSGRVEVDHVMASAALIPDFPPVEIEGRLLIDGGFAANLPVTVILQELFDASADERATCLAADLFPLAAPLPRGLLEAAQRQNDLLFASQTRRSLESMERLWRGRRPGVDVLLTSYEALEEETALKGFDFSAGTLARRITAGARDMGRLLAVWRDLPPGGTGMRLVMRETGAA